MTKIQHNLLCFFILLLPGLSFGQTVYEGQVINSVTELPIQGATVKLLKGNLGTQTNAQGYFRIAVENAIGIDTLQFSSVGYNVYKQAVTANQPQMIITLNASNTTLNEVRITAEKVKPITLGKFNISDVREINSKAMVYQTMSFGFGLTPMCAKFFTLPNKNMMLTTVKLGRRNFEYATIGANTQFLLHILLADTTDGKPGKSIFTKKISLTDNAQLITIDLIKEKITIPGTGFFVAIEWMQIPINEVVTQALKDDFDQKGKEQPYTRPVYKIAYQPALVLYTRYFSHLKWLRLGGMYWGPPCCLPEFAQMVNPPTIWLKTDGIWRGDLCSHELALSVTLTN